MAAVIQSFEPGSSILTDLNTLNLKDAHIYDLIDNYIYLYHLDTFVCIPSYMDSISDTMSINYSSSTPLQRSAPIYSYQNSGPRQVQMNIMLHRDMMTQINYGVSNAPIGTSVSPFSSINDDYVDFIIKAIQSIAVPNYAESLKMVNPPLVALKMGQDIFIKGVVTGSVGVTYHYPILKTGKYSNVTLTFTVNEVDPYDAETVLEVGGYRGLDTTLERKLNGGLKCAQW